MQDKVTYEFAVIRIVPRVEREEFINVGVILFAKAKKYLGIKYAVDENRLKAFSDEVELQTLKENLAAWELICQGKPEAGTIGQLDLPSRFRWLTATKSTIIQCSPTHPGLCDNPEPVLEDLFELYVS